jgi:hypothetical protein
MLHNLVARLEKAHVVRREQVLQQDGEDFSRQVSQTHLE